MQKSDTLAMHLNMKYRLTLYVISAVSIMVLLNLKKGTSS